MKAKFKAGDKVTVYNIEGSLEVLSQEVIKGCPYYNLKGIHVPVAEMYLNLVD